MIGVIRKNFQEAVVEDHVLDSLIASNRIIAFHRSNVWAVVGRDAVRERNTYHTGEERRKIVHGKDFCMK
ncbi:MAG: hypothetical protein RW306_06860 [Geobacteraceae bacterium]|nr:hypothetical protein [Geobacteraceae bacterium]